MKAFDSAMLAPLRKEIDAALVAIAAKHNITLKAGNVSYTPGGTFTFKLDGAVAGALPKDAQRLEAERGGFLIPQPWAYGTEFNYAKRVMILRGLSSTGAKVLIDDAVTGKGYTAKLEDFRRSATIRAEQVVPQ